MGTEAGGVEAAVGASAPGRRSGASTEAASIGLPGDAADDGDPPLER
ncbi:hypothetical protein [Streptacidiphilus anmyonensis]|nr:hypothetical protein [Streptacidiphilus anmyonensis]